MEFYDALADDYDAMIGFDARLATARRFAQALHSRCAFDTVLDVACGTGVYALAFSEFGCRRVVGTDLSSGMLGAARKRGDELGLATIEWVPAPMQELARHIDGTFDLITCLGNSMPHLLTPTDLAATLEGFGRLLAPGGHLVLHWLNYDRILARRERVVEITRQGDAEYIRFYDFMPELVRFNILTVHWGAHQAVEHTLLSSDLCPYALAQMSAALERHGFAAPRAYDGLTFRRFDVTVSDTVLLTAERAR